jgi:hypothetical protein
MKAQAAEDDERGALLVALAGHRVTGLEDFGRLVNDTTHVAPSAFDVRSSWPVLLEWFPRLSQPGLVETVARYLGQSGLHPRAFPALEAGFRRWAGRDAGPGWTIGASLAAAATIAQLPPLLDLATDERFGRDRQMIVESLWRYGKNELVAPVLIDLIHDPDVGLHAMSALRRTLGNAAALPHLEHLGAATEGTPLGERRPERSRSPANPSPQQRPNTDHRTNTRFPQSPRWDPPLPQGIGVQHSHLPAPLPRWPRPMKRPLRDP